MRRLIFVLGFFFIAISAKANDVYISSAGGGTGASCNSAKDSAYFNSSGNWTTGTPTGIQIGPGTTVHLCATFTATAGSTLLTAQGSGTSGSPITILFEPGAVLTAPYWSSTGAIVLRGKSWIVVNGDINNGRQGVIQNTDNGSNRTYQQMSRMIYSNGCSNCTVKNITLANAYVKVPDVAISSISGDGQTATVTCATACNNSVNHQVAIVGNSTPGFNTPTNSTVTITSTPDSTHLTFSSTTTTPGSGGSLTDSGAPWKQIVGNYIGGNVSPNFTVDNVLVHDAGWALDGSAQNYTIKNSEVYNADHGVSFGTIVNIGGLDIHGNHFHDFAAWDTANGTYHHDYIHLWDNQAPGTAITDGVIYNNTFDGLFANCCTTAMIYLEGAVHSVAVFNNTFIEDPAAPIGKKGVEVFGEANGGGENNSILNNYFSVGPHGPAGSGNAILGSSQSGLTVENNIVIGGQYDITMASTSINTINYEIYDDLKTDYGDLNIFQWNPQPSTYFLSTWQSECLCDANSVLLTNANIKVNSGGVPQSGSPALGTGANLMSLATGARAPLASDKNGVPRPTSANWDIGAFQQPVGHPISLVQTVTRTYANNTTLSTTAFTETAGNFLVTATTYVTNVTASVTDTLGNTWHPLPAQTNGNTGCGTGSNNNFSGAQLWYAENIKGGSNTVTLTLSGQSFLWLEVVEYSGVKTSGSLLANTGSSSTTAVSSISTGNLNAGGPNNLIVAAFTDTDQARASMSAGTGYTFEGIYGGNGSMLEDRVSVPPGAYNPSATYNNGADSCGAATGAAFTSQ